jgi:hypothetical protein
MRNLLAILLLLTVPATAQIVGAGNRKVFSSGGGIAIAFDNASILSTATSTSLTYSFTVGSSGTNRMLFVGVRVTSTATPTVTYAGASMTLVKSATFNFGADVNYLFALVAPATGANNVVVTVGTSSGLVSSAVSYTGVFQSTTMDNSTSNNTTGSTATVTLTTIANNCWTVAFTGASNSSTITAGAGSTLRSNTGQVAAMFDSNGPKTPAGSTSMTVNIGVSTSQATLMVSFTHA